MSMSPWRFWRVYVNGRSANNPSFGGLSFSSPGKVTTASGSPEPELMSAVRSVPYFCDWQDKRSYAGLLSLIRHRWAWEFLRRNPDFQKDFSKLSDAVASIADEPNVYNLLADCPLKCWGIFFRNLLECGCRCLLGSAPVLTRTPVKSGNRIAGLSQGRFQCACL
ncbi:transcriptional regulator domain-containing protein [Roseibium album]|uniref:transcriptional regulator domain-containing protein n=1 Tax=Roseibium album TaxID=311410 RepID=UPI0032EBB78D